MFDAVKVEHRGEGSGRASHANSSHAHGNDDGKKSYVGSNVLKSKAETQRQMLDRQNNLIHKVNHQRMSRWTGGALLWQITGGFLVLVVVSMVLTSGKGDGARKGWDNKSALPYNELDDGEIGSRWTTSRLCTHFNAPTPSRVRFAFGMNTKKQTALHTKAWRRVDVIQVNVGFRLHEDAKNGGSAKGWRNRAKLAFDAVTGMRKDGVPVVVSDTSPYSAKSSEFEFVDFLSTFLSMQLSSGQIVGREQGLMVTFVDPRAIEVGLKILRRFIVTGRIPGPLIIDGEILPGPGGFLSQLGSVFYTPPEHDNSHSHSEQEHHLFVPPVPGDTDETTKAERIYHSFDFDPRFDFVDKIKKYTPGVIIGMRWSTHGGCVDGAVASDAREAYSAWYKSSEFDWDWAESEQSDENNAHQSAAAAMKMFTFAGGMAKELAESVANGRRKVLDHGKDHDEEEEDGHYDDDDDDSDSDEDDDDDSDPTPTTPPLLPPTKATTVSQFTYDDNSASLRNEAEGSLTNNIPVYYDQMFDDAYWLFRNATWRGDVIFGVETCILASPDPDGDLSDTYPYKKLLQQKLGWTIMLRGSADDAALAFARGDAGKELGQETHGTNRGAPEAATTFVGEVRRVRDYSENDRKRKQLPLRPTQVLTPTKLTERLAQEEGTNGGEDGEL